MRILADRAHRTQIAIPPLRFGIVLKRGIFLHIARDVDPKANHSGSRQLLNALRIQLNGVFACRKNGEHRKSCRDMDDGGKLSGLQSLQSTPQLRPQLIGIELPHRAAVIRSRVDRFFFRQHAKVGP